MKRTLLSLIVVTALAVNAAQASSCEGCPSGKKKKKEKQNSSQAAPSESASESQNQKHPAPNQ